MLYKDIVQQKEIQLTYENYKEILSKQRPHIEIIKTVHQYAFDTANFFKSDFIAEKVFIVASSLYFHENLIMSYTNNTEVLTMLLATYCVRLIVEEINDQNG